MLLHIESSKSAGNVKVEGLSNGPEFVPDSTLLR